MAASLRLNVAANYAGRVWSIASIYAFVPAYIRILGLEAYGLIAFYSVALAILFIADAGLSAAFARQAAAAQDKARLGDLLVTVERLLLAIVGTAALVMLALAKPIAQDWLNPTAALPVTMAADCVRLMTFALVPQILMSLYFGGLMGMQRQVRANALTTLFSVARSGLVLAPIAVWPDPRVFFAWQAVIGWAFLLLMRAQLRHELDVHPFLGGRFDWRAFEPLIPYAVGMFAMSVIAGLNSQLDRLVVSKMRPLQEFSYYTLAATLAQIPTIATMPIAQALLPRFTAQLVGSRHAELRSLYARGTYVVATIGSVAAFSVILFAQEILAIWMGSDVTPDYLGPVIRTLALGGLFLALQLTPFQLSLAHGHNRTNVRLGAVVLVVTVPLQVVLTDRYGLTGAAVPWLLLNAFAFVYLGWILNRRFARADTGAWFVLLTAIPVCISLLAMSAARSTASWLGAEPLAACSIAVLGCALGFGGCYFVWSGALRRLF